MNRFKKYIVRILIAVLALAVIFVIGFTAYMEYLKLQSRKAVIAAKDSPDVTANRSEAQAKLFTIEEAPTEVYFLDEALGLDARFYDGRLYVPYEESTALLEEKIGEENAELYDVKFNNFIFSGYTEESANPFFLEVDGKCYISFYKLIKGMGLAAVFDSENDKVTVCYRKTDTSDLPKIVKSEDAKPALLRLEDITPDAYCKSPRYTDEGLEKLRAAGEYLERREQRFYIACIMRYVNPEEGIDLDLTRVTNTYTADFIYTLDYLIDKGGRMVLHGYTHQFGDYFSADGFEFGYFSPLSVQERAERLLKAKDNAALLGYDNSMWEFPHYGATPSDLVMAEEVYSVIFQSANKTVNSDNIVTKKIKSGKIVTYVPLPAYYLNNIYELDDMLNRIDECEKQGCVVGLFFHPSIDFEKIETDTTPWGVRNWYYTPYWALPVITDKILSDGYSFSYFEDIN